jgi:hypothetical protein
LVSAKSSLVSAKSSSASSSPRCQKRNNAVACAKRIAPLTHWKHYVAPLLEALHWTATVFVAMLAVVFLSWAVAITARQNHGADVGDDAAQPINLTF